MNIKNSIPNFITSLNLLFGSISILFALSGRHDVAAICIFSAAVFDFFDGFAARLLHAYSPMGKELDSLADMVSFGVAPAVLLSYMMMRLVIKTDKLFGVEYIKTEALLFIVFPLLIAVFAGLRLAKFNIDTRQSDTFLGLTTTATGMFIASFSYMVYSKSPFFHLFYDKWVLVVMVAVFCTLLVSEVPMFSLKFKTWDVKSNLKRYSLLAFALTAVVIFGVGGIALTITAYIVVSLVEHFWQKLFA